MDCPDCGAPTVAFAVPPDLRAYAPGETAAICPDCLRTAPTDAEPAPEPAFDRVDPAVPRGEAGVAFALLLGTLDSLALNREAATELWRRVERAGADPRLALDRLDGREAAVDLDRRTAQLVDLL